MSTGIITALITTSGAILVAVLGLVGTIWKLRQENRAQHDDNKAAFTEAIGGLSGKVDVIHDDVRDISHRLDEHMRNHAPTIAAQVISHPRHTTGGNSDVA